LIKSNEILQNTGQLKNYRFNIKRDNDIIISDYIKIIL